MNNLLLTDSHCHLHLLDLTPDNGQIEPVLARAKANNVHYMLCVATELSQTQTLKNYADNYPDSNISFSVGIHPNHAPGEIFSPEDILELTHHPKLVAIGETGLDYFRSEGNLDWQRDRFISHIEVAKQIKKPLIVHTRAAQADTMRILKEESARDAGGVMHCFTEDWDMAKKAMDLGLYISFSGIVTFKNAIQLQEVAAKVPLSRLLIETDCPYLAPIPHRGKPNEPGFVLHVAEFLAKLRGISLEEIAQVSTQNYLDLFKPI